MDVVGRKVENQVQFWSLLGPFFVLLSIAVLLFKVSPHWYFPVSALIGIPLCVKWKMKGMATALCCLFLLAGISYQDLELDDRYWHVGLSLAMAFSFIVLTLSLEEVEGLVCKLQLESQSRLDNFLLLDEKWKSAEQEWSFEKEKSKIEVASLTQELTKIQEDKQTFYKLAQLAKDELIQVRGQHDQLLQDLLYKKQQIAQLYERLEETEITIQSFVNSDSEKQILALTDCIACLEQEKETFKAKVVLAQKEERTCQVDKENLRQELLACQEREKLCLIDQYRYHQEKQDQQNALQVLQTRCLLMEQEKQALFPAQVKLQQQYEQMRLLEAQYCQTIQQSQHKIQELEIRLLEGEKQKEALQLRRKEIEEQVLYQDKQAKQREEHYRSTLEQLKKQVEEERDKDEVKLKHYQQQILQQSQQEQNVLQEHCHKLNEDLLRTESDLKITQEALNDICAKEEQYKIDMRQLQQELKVYQENEAKLKQNLLEEQVLVREIKDLQECCQINQEELNEVRDRLEVKNAALNEMQEKINSLSSDLQEQQFFVKQSAEQNQRLENLKMELEQALQETQNQLQKTKQKQDTSDRRDEKLPYARGNTRQIESMYLQLKEQFQEKNHVLHATRRELFHVNEELLKYRREYEEEHIFDEPVNERRLQRHIVRLGSEFEHMQKLYQQEVDELTDLVGDLLKQIKA